MQTSKPRSVAFGRPPGCIPHLHLGHKAYWIARLGRLYDVHLVSTRDPRFVERCHFHHVPIAENASHVAELARHAGRIAAIPTPATRCRW